MRNDIKFCQAADGVRIAYAVSGSGSPIVVSGLLYRHLEYDRDSPFWSDAFEVLAKQHTLIRFDIRGTGLSQRDVPDYSLEDLASDLSAVVEAAGVQRFALLGIATGGAPALLYAARHPDRVTHLLIYGSSARSLMHRGPDSVDLAKGLLALIRRHWGTEDPTYRVIALGRVFPDADEQLLEKIAEIERRCASASDAAKAYAMAFNVNIVDQLSQIRMPTLIFQPKNAVLHPQERAHEIAAHVPHARVIPIDGSSSYLMNDDLATELFLFEARRFLGDPAVSVRRLRNVFRRAYLTCHDMVASAPYKVVYGILALLAALASVVYYTRSLL